MYQIKKFGERYYNKDSEHLSEKNALIRRKVLKNMGYNVRIERKQSGYYEVWFSGRKKGGIPYEKYFKPKVREKRHVIHIEE